MGLIYFVSGVLLCLLALSIPLWNETVRLWLIKQKWAGKFVTLWMAIWTTWRKNLLEEKADKFLTDFLRSESYAGYQWEYLESAEKREVRRKLQDELKQMDSVAPHDFWKIVERIKGAGLTDYVHPDVRKLLFEKAYRGHVWTAETMSLVRFCYGELKDVPTALLLSILKPSIQEGMIHTEWIDHLSEEQQSAVADLDTVRNDWENLDTLFGTVPVPTERAKTCFDTLLSAKERDMEQLENCCLAIRDWNILLRLLKGADLSTYDPVELLRQMNVDQAKKADVSPEMINAIGLYLAELGDLDALDAFYWDYKNFNIPEENERFMTLMEEEATTRREKVPEYILAECMRKNVTLIGRKQDAEIDAALCVWSLQDLEVARSLLPRIQNQAEAYGYVARMLNAAEMVSSAHAS